MYVDINNNRFYSIICLKKSIVTRFPSCEGYPGGSDLFNLFFYLK